MSRLASAARREVPATATCLVHFFLLCLPPTPSMVGLQVRPCHVGDLCPGSRGGLLLSTGLTLTLDVSKDDIAGDDSGLWMEWVGIAIGDAIARLASMQAGNVRATVVSDDPNALDVRNLGARASVPCTAQVEMHLTPKVDDVGADRVSKVANLPSFPETLTSELETSSHQHWLLREATITITSAEKVAMFIASNGDAYTPPDSNRLQSERPRSSIGGSQVRVVGALAFVTLVIVAIGTLVWRVRTLAPEDKRYEPVAQQVEMSVRKQGFSTSGRVSGVLEGAESGGSFRRAVKTPRGDKDMSSTGPPE